LIYFPKTFPEIRFCIIHVHETIRFLPLRKRTVVIGLKNGEMATDKKILSIILYGFGKKNR
jgi:hypothetical protein